MVPSLPTDRFVTAGDAQLAYGTRGEAGTPVLLVAGYTVPGQVWVHQVPGLAEHHQVLWFDHRGCGNTRARPRPYTMDLLASDVRALLDRQGWDEAHVVGVSMGGMVAQHLALGAPKRVRSLSLLVTHAGGWRARLPSLAGVRRFLQANLARETEQRFAALERLLFPDAFLQSCDRSWLREVLVAEFARPVPLASRLSQLAAVMRHDTRQRLHQIAAPTLIVQAGCDLLVSPAGSARLHRGIPDAQLVSFPDAGHGLIRQHHERITELLLEHFAAVEQREAGAT